MLTDDRPLGPVLCYDWKHHKPARPEAQLCLEQTAPFRINFIAYNADRSTLSESGWHGCWFLDVCKMTSPRRNQRGGDRIITLQGFRYMGMAAPWTHNNFKLYLKEGETKWRCISCDCRRSSHPVTMKVICGMVQFSNCNAPGPVTLDGFDVV